MFFIYNDKSQIDEWQEQRGSRSQEDLNIPAAYLIPDLKTFIVIEPAVINAQVSAEVLLQFSYNLGSQCDFRYEV